jgi:hypothetical protein
MWFAAGVTLRWSLEIRTGGGAVWSGAEGTFRLIRAFAGLVLIVELTLFASDWQWWWRVRRLNPISAAIYIGAIGEERVYGVLAVR